MTTVYNHDNDLYSSFFPATSCEGSLRPLFFAFVALIVQLYLDWPPKLLTSPLFIFFIVLVAMFFPVFDVRLDSGTKHGHIGEEWYFGLG